MKVDPADIRLAQWLLSGSLFFVVGLLCGFALAHQDPPWWVSTLFFAVLLISSVVHLVRTRNLTKRS